MLEKESQNHEFLVIVDELLDSINSGDIIANKVGMTHRLQHHCNYTIFLLQQDFFVATKLFCSNKTLFGLHVHSFQVSFRVGNNQKIFPRFFQRHFLTLSLFFSLKAGNAPQRHRNQI